MLKNTKRRLSAITDAGRYIGSVLAEFIRAEGWVVYELRHHIDPTQSHNEFIVPYDLTGDPPTWVLERVDALVHCAYDFRRSTWDDIYAVNVRGSVRLFQAAKDAGVGRAIFLSSLSAFDGCTSLYGKAKLLVEVEALTLGAIVIRPGLVYGSNKGGVIKLLESVVSMSSIVPLVGRGDQIFFMAHETDLCELIAKICLDGVKETSAPVVAASELGKTFKEILQILAQAKGKRLYFVPVNWRLILAGLRFFEYLGLNLGFRSDSLISLINLNSEPDFDSARRMGVDFRDFSIGDLQGTNR